MASLFRCAEILILVALFINSALSHTYLSSIVLDNQALAEGDCVRPHPSTAFDSPIPLVTSADMTCGWLPQAANPTSRKCPIAAGSSIGLQWHHTSASPSDDILDPSHVGPILVYMAKSDTGSGDVWFKIYEDGYNGKWAVDRLLANKGRVDVTIPADIAPGNYLLRGEILALHGAYATNGIQPYVGCVELTVSGSGSANPTGVAMPGYYKNTDPGMIFDLYNGFSSYTIPGPAVYSAGSSSGSRSSQSPSSTQAPTSTQAPSATQAPSSTQASSPSSSPTQSNRPSKRPTNRPRSENIHVGLNTAVYSEANEYSVSAVVSGGGETTVKVEMMDSGSIKSWVPMTDLSYAFAYKSHSEIKAPISLRLTSSTGKQVVLTDVFQSLYTSGTLSDSGKVYE